MANLSGPEVAAWYAGIVLSFGVVVRLLLSGLVGRYRGLTAFLAISVARSILLASIPFDSNAYAEAYLYTTPVFYAAHIWLVVELYGHAFESYRGIAALGRWTISGALLIGAGLAVATTMVDHDLSREPFPILGLMFKLEAIVTKTLMAFLLLICAILAWFPIPQRRNVILIGFGTTALFISLTSSLVVRGLNPTSWTRLASTSSLYVYAVCTGLWLLALKSKSRDVPAERPIQAGGARESILTGQLQTMNQALESLRKAG